MMLAGIVVLIVPFLVGSGDAAVVNKVVTGTLSWQIEVTTYFSYKTAAQRDNLLQQILDLWKSSFDAKFRLTDEQIKVIREQSAPAGFDDFKQITFKISGKGPTGTNIQSLVASFQTILTQAHIPGVQMTLSRETAQTIYTIQIEVEANFRYTTITERDRMLQQILSLFRTKFAKYSFTNLKIEVISEQPSVVTGMKLLKFRITGQTTIKIDVNDLTTQFRQQIQISHIIGITLPTETTTIHTFTLESTVTLKFITTVERDRLLQQILKLWIQTYGIKYGIKNPQITVITSTKLPNGLWLIKFRITGTSTITINVHDIIVDFRKILISAHITGIIITEEGEETTTSGSDHNESTESSDVPIPPTPEPDTPAPPTPEPETPAPETPVPPTPEPDTPAPEPRTPEPDVTTTETAVTDKTTCGKISINQINGKTVYRGSFTASFTVYLTYKTTTIRNTLLQQLLAIWGDILVDQADNLKMCYVSEELNVGKTLTGLIMNKVTYSISGTATTTFNTAAIAKLFEAAVAEGTMENVFFTIDFGQCAAPRLLSGA